MKHLTGRPTINNPLKNQKGFLTLDFIFATLLMFSFSALLFIFSITFSAFEIAQYVTFSSSRAYFAAHKNETRQQARGQAKFKALIRDQKAPLGVLFRNGWFEIGDVVLNDFNSDFSDDPDKDSGTFVGARALIKAKILNFKFPLLGGAKDEMSASTSSYLMREPTEEECISFTNDRFEHAQALKPGFDQTYINVDQYVPIMDDGC
jgi:hypothetical protein